MNLALDIGGTKTRIGLISDSYKLLDSFFLLTDKNYESGVKNIFNFIKNQDVRISKICLGIAGVMNQGKLYSSPNMKNWIGKPIETDFKKEFSAEVYIENDAALAGLGEAIYGAGKNHKIVSYITVSTGVGGSRIVNGMIDNKVYGFEPGKHRIFCKKSPSSFESLVSGKSIKKIYDQDAEKISDKKVWGEIMKNVALGVTNSIYFWSPEIVVLGGGVALSESFDIQLLREEVEKRVIKTYPKVPVITKAALGDFSGIWGGIAYLRSAV